MMLGMHAYSMTHPLTLVIAIVLYYSSAVVTHNRFISQPRPPSFLLAVAVTRASRGGECRLLYPLVTAWLYILSRVSVLDTRSRLGR